MSISIDPFRPYLPLAWLLLAVVLLFGGCSWGKSIQSVADAKALKASADALAASETSLRAAADALRRQNADNKLRIADAERTAKLADAGKADAQHQVDALRVQMDGYAKQLRAAAKRSPDCDALLNSDLLKVCGL